MVLKLSGTILEGYKIMFYKLSGIIPGVQWVHKLNVTILVDLKIFASRVGLFQVVS